MTINFHIIYLILEMRQNIIIRECASNWRTLFSLGSMWIILGIYIPVDTCYLSFCFGLQATSRSFQSKQNIRLELTKIDIKIDLNCRLK